MYFLTDAITHWASPVLVALQTVFLWVVWSLKRHFVAKAEHEALADRVGVVEVRLERMPDKDALHALQLDMANFRGDIRTIIAQNEGVVNSMTALARGLERLENYQLGNGK